MGWGLIFIVVLHFFIKELLPQNGLLFFIIKVTLFILLYLTYAILVANNEEKRWIKKLSDLVVESQYKNIMMSGCGEEQAMWERIKKNFINR